MEEFIRKELKEKIISIKKQTDSYSCNVYLVTTNNNKYIFKVLKTEEKRRCEAIYLNYLYNNIPVPKLIKTNLSNNISYNFIEYIDGISYSDNNAKNLTTEELQEIGRLLAKLHSLKLLKLEDKWFKYLNDRITSTYKLIKDTKIIKDNDNEKLYIHLIDELNNKIKNNYELSILHMDFRLGNLIKKDKLYLIDFESMKNGDCMFDFIKLKRLLTASQFKIMLNAYSEIKKIPDNYEEKIEFYNIFDTYTTLEWCSINNQLEGEFYNSKIKELKKYVKRKF